MYRHKPKGFIAYRTLDTLACTGYFLLEGDIGVPTPTMGGRGVGHGIGQHRIYNKKRCGGGKGMLGRVITLSMILMKYIEFHK
jgi:hypothetical protein